MKITQSRRPLPLLLAFCVCLTLPCLVTGQTNRSEVVDFEEIDLGTNGFANGSDLSGGFTSKGAFFRTVFNPEFNFWQGVAASEQTDTTTPGFLNQYSSFSGDGVDDSQQYAVVFDGDSESDIRFHTDTTVHGAWINNTTYAGLVMQDGDSVFGLDPFGGPSGDEPDRFELAVTGIDQAGAQTGQVTFDLADFTPSDSAADTIVEDWTYLDLSPLGDEVRELQFDLASTDRSFGFNNTPNYFALDDLSFSQSENSVSLFDNRVYVWEDLNSNGIYDETAGQALVGVAVEVFDSNGAFIAVRETGMDGSIGLAANAGAMFVHLAGDALSEGLINPNEGLLVELGADTNGVFAPVLLPLELIPTAIELASFSAEAEDENVVLFSWETASEMDTMGFELLWAAGDASESAEPVGLDTFVVANGEADGSSYSVAVDIGGRGVSRDSGEWILRELDTSMKETDYRLPVRAAGDSPSEDGEAL